MHKFGSSPIGYEYFFIPGGITHGVSVWGRPLSALKVLCNYLHIFIVQMLVSRILSSKTPRLLDGKLGGRTARALSSQHDELWPTGWHHRFFAMWPHYPQHRQGQLPELQECPGRVLTGHSAKWSSPTPWQQWWGAEKKYEPVPVLNAIVWMELFPVCFCSWAFISPCESARLSGQWKLIELISWCPTYAYKNLSQPGNGTPKKDILSLEPS